MRRRGGFTLIELLGVMAIIVILVGISVPAFSGMLRSSRASLANGTLRSALVQARDAALQSVDGGDSAAVFFFDPGGSASIVVCTQAGSIRGVDAGGRPVERDVFVADPSFEVQVLPPFWHVNGLARAGTINGADDMQPGAWYANTRYDGASVNWVFPETGFFDPAKPDEGPKRHTFFVRFSAGTGELDITNDQEALVYVPSLDLDRSSSPFSMPAFRPDRKSDHRLLIRQLLSSTQVSPQDRERLIGDTATDSVLMHPVREIALYDVRDLAKKLRSERVSAFKGIDSQTGSLYRSSGRGEPTPTIDPELVSEVNRLLPRVAEIFSLDRYTGAARRIPVAQEEVPS